VLRKLAFSPQTFEDLDVEKEVAVRRRLAKECVVTFLVGNITSMTKTDSTNVVRTSMT
jgi:hypothetical protein